MVLRVFNTNRRLILLRRLTTGCILMLCVYTMPSLAQDKPDSLQELKSKAVRIFIDCDYCDLDYIRSEITFVNYVRDRSEAQVHLLITTQRTGSGGKEYTITFIGQQEYAGINDTLTFNSKKADTEETIRTGLVRNLKLGLVRYVAKTPMADQISVSYNAASQGAEAVDKWNYWVFSANINSYFNGEKSTNSLSLYGSLSANRVTPDLKVNLSINGNYNENNFDISDTETVSSFSRSKSFRSSVVFSLTDHWSTGILADLSSSTYNNRTLYFNPAIAIEYNLFPYSESTRRQLRFGYYPNYNYFRYDEETIFDKTSEALLGENLFITLEVKETWGSTSTTLEGSHYFHDFNKNRLELSSELSLRLIEGFSLRLYGNVSRIHDQLSLPKRGASTEEILLRRSQLATQYQYFGSVGLSFTFGSIYNNVVNPRFGD